MTTTQYPAGLATPFSPSYSLGDLALALAELAKVGINAAAPVIVLDEDVKQLAAQDPRFGSVWCYITQVVWDEQRAAWRLQVR